MVISLGWGLFAWGLVGLSLVIWVVLVGFWGQFWRCNQRLENDIDESTPLLTPHSPLPAIIAVVPARNEADVLPVSLRSLLTQNYPGEFRIILVDDHSTDGTAQVAAETAAAVGQADRLQVIQAQPLLTGWSGKLWAMDQGVKAAQQWMPDYILLTDADIEHDVANVQRLFTKASQSNLDMASVMVRLRCESVWEKLLIPAFVFFFMKLYPFPWVNNPQKRTAGAAGGCILLRREALTQIGGIERIRQALIDDCALAIAVKAEGGKSTVNGKQRGNIWLGLSDHTRSLRPYPTLETIWNMVARTAYTQLSYNPFLLMGTLVGMTLVYLVPPVGVVVGALMGQWAIALTALAAYLLMTLAYFPTIRFYRCSPLYTFCLPAIAFLYTLMTFDSALRHWRGQGGSWKGRTYEIS